MSYRDDFRDVEREAWWTFPRFIVALLAFVLLAYGVGFLATGGDLAIYKFWAPKRANAEREVFVHTNSYIQGKTDYIGRLRYEYQTADEGHKAALKSLILSEASTVDNTLLPPDTQTFLNSLKGTY